MLLSPDTAGLTALMLRTSVVLVATVSMQSHLTLFRVCRFRRSVEMLQLPLPSHKACNTRCADAETLNSTSGQIHNSVSCSVIPRGTEEILQLPPSPHKAVYTPVALTLKRSVVPVASFKMSCHATSFIPDGWAEIIQQPLF